MQKKLIVWIALAVAAAALFFGLTRSGVPASGDIDNAQLRKLVAEGARLVDVRTAGEYAAGHIPDAENVPVDEFPKTAAEWDRGAAIVLYCATGARSLNAAQWATSNGFTKVYNLKAGIVAWDGEASTQSGGSRTISEPSASGLPVMLDFTQDG